jgi:Ni,Fe-hydrogenase I large subunit
VGRRHRACSLDPAAIVEDVSHAWMAGDAAATRPGPDPTDADKADAYTWCKAPRYGGQVVETGALARQMVAGHPLIRDGWPRKGGSVTARVLARLLELAAGGAGNGTAGLKALTPGEPWCHARRTARRGCRRRPGGSRPRRLGHWLSVRHGRIERTRSSPPPPGTSRRATPPARPARWSRRWRAAGEPDDPTPVAVQHVVRSFDPCMVCTVH